MKGILCARCNYQLYVPVMIDQNSANICLKCFNSTIGEYDPKFRNYTLESLYLQTKVPCTFQKYGCDFSVSYANLNYHVKSCPYKRKPCPYYKNCPWFGSVINIPKHFENEHGTCFVKSSDGVHFLIHVKLIRYLRINFLLINSYGQYVLKLYKEDNIIYYNLCFVGRSRKYCDFKYKIEEIFYPNEFYLKTVNNPAYIDSEMKIRLFNKCQSLAIPLYAVCQQIAKVGEGYMVLKLYTRNDISLVTY